MVFDADNTLLRLRQVEQRVYSQSISGRNNEPLVQVIKMVELVIKCYGSQLIDELDEWIHDLFHRLMQTLIAAEQLCECIPKYSEFTAIRSDNITKSLLSDFWLPYKEEYEHLLKDGDLSFCMDRLKEGVETKKFDEELSQRKKHFENIYGPTKPLRELRETYRVFLKGYLKKCVSFHQCETVQGLGGENIDELLRQICGDASILLTDEEKQSVETLLGRIAIPLRLSSHRIKEIEEFSSHKLKPSENSEPYFIPSVEEKSFRDTSREIRSRTTRITVSDLLTRHRWSVILADPGCGKTTLLRWITAHVADAFLQEETSLILKKGSDIWEDQYTGKIDFGPVRIPILIRIGELAEWLDEDPVRTLLDYIGLHTWYGIPYLKKEDASILREFLHHGHAILLLDGLDEVSDYEQRRKMVRLIDAFMEEHIRAPSHNSLNDEERTVMNWRHANYDYGSEPSDGNQLIITSRFIGYRFFPLTGKQLEHFSFCHISQAELKFFINHWINHVHNSIIQRINPYYRIRLNKKRVKSARKTKKLHLQTLLDHADERIRSHPMLLSLTLPLLLKQEECKKRISCIAIYTNTVQITLNTWTLAQGSMLTSEVVEWFLRDMAIHIQEHCRTGLIDTFDLTRLSLVSLKAFYKNKNMISSADKLKTQSQELLHLLTTNLSFVAARGFDAFGFVHRTYQEYFVAMTFVKIYEKKIQISPLSVIDYLFVYVMKPNFRQPIALAVSWINEICGPDVFDVFCTALLKKEIGSMPIGAVLLIDIVEYLFIPPASHVLCDIFDRLLTFSSVNILLKYFRRGLSRMTGICSDSVNNCFRQTPHTEMFYRFLLNSFEKMHDGSFSLPPWLPEDTYLYLMSLNHDDENIMAIVNYYRHNKIRTTTGALICHAYSLSHCFSQCELMISDIHPAVLSVILALCGGLCLKPKESYEPAAIQFDSNQMYCPTSIPEVLMEYLTNAKTDPTGSLQQFIQTCEQIICTASVNDVSQRVVDACVTLICLQGVQQPLKYKRFVHHKGLSLALYRLKIVLSHLRQVYAKKHTSFFADSINYGEDCANTDTSFLTDHSECDEYGSLIQTFLCSPQTNTQSLEATLLAITAASNRLAYHTKWKSNSLFSLFDSIKDSSNFTDIMKFASLRFLSHLLSSSSFSAETDCQKWAKSEHIYQLLHSHILFPAAFLPSHLQPLFERLMLTNRQNSIANMKQIETLLLSELLLHIYHITTKPVFDTPSFRLLLFLTVMDKSIREHGMESFISVFLWRMSITKGTLKRTDIPECVQCFILNYSQNTMEMIAQNEQDRIAAALRLSHEQNVDLELFAASIELARVSEYTRQHEILFEKAKEAAQAVRDPVLKLLCHCHLRKITCLWINSDQYYLMRQVVRQNIDKLPFDLPLLMLTFILVVCLEEEEEELLDLSLRKLFELICVGLSSEPTNEQEHKDHQAAYQALRHFFDEQKDILPVIFSRSDINDILQMNSPCIAEHFDNITSLDDSNKTLLCVLYLIEVAVDAQILARFTNVSEQCSSVHPFIAGYGHLWKLSDGIFLHQSVVIINQLLHSKWSSTIYIPMEKLIECTGFEARDRSKIESWLRYHEDDHRRQFALFGAFLLVRSGIRMMPSVEASVEMILMQTLYSNVDIFRRYARTCFSGTKKPIQCGVTWSTSMWFCLKKLFIGSFYGKYLGFRITSIETMNILLELERQRLLSSHVDDKYEYMSFLLLISNCSDEVSADLLIYIHDLLAKLKVSENFIKQDEHIAIILVNIVRKFEDDQWTENWYKLLTELVYDSRLPCTQRAVVYTLKSQERGKMFLQTLLLAHICELSSIDIKVTSDNTRIYNETVSDEVLLACLWTLTGSQSNLIRQDAELKTGLLKLYRLSKSTHVSLLALSCALCPVLNSQESFEDLQVRLALNITELYSMFVMNMSCLTEWDVHSDWITKTVSLIDQYQSPLIQVFVNDFYTKLSADFRSTSGFQDPKPNLIAIADILAYKCPEAFCRTIQKTAFGEEEFKKALCQVINQGTARERCVCIKLYCMLSQVTEKFIEIMFAACLEDFSCLQREAFAHIQSIDDREIIESLFVYLKSSSLSQRYLAAKWLVELVHTNKLSAMEVQELLEIVLQDPVSKQISYDVNEGEEKPLKELIEALLLRMTCIEPLPELRLLPAVNMEEVELDFNDALYALDRLKDNWNQNCY